MNWVAFIVITFIFTNEKTLGWEPGLEFVTKSACKEHTTIMTKKTARNMQMITSFPFTIEEGCLRADKFRTFKNTVLELNEEET